MTLATLPLASREEPGPRPRGASAAEPLSASWQQALQERAHALSWFQDALSPGDAVVDLSRAHSSAVPVPTLATARAGLAGPGPSPGRHERSVDGGADATRDEGDATSASANNAEPASTRAGPVRSDATSLFAPVLLDAPQDSGRPALPRRAEDVRETGPPHPWQHGADAAREPVRVHVEQGDAGLMVWIGLDAAQAGAGLQAAHVTSALLRSTELKGRVSSVTCNGIPTYASGRTAHPWAPTRAHHDEEQA